MWFSHYYEVHYCIPLIVFNIHIHFCCNLVQYSESVDDSNERCSCLGVVCQQTEGRGNVVQ